MKLSFQLFRKFLSYKYSGNFISCPTLNQLHIFIFYFFHSLSSTIPIHVLGVTCADSTSLVSSCGEDHRICLQHLIPCNTCHFPTRSHPAVIISLLNFQFLIRSLFTLLFIAFSFLIIIYKKKKNLIFLLLLFSVIVDGA